MFAPAALAAPAPHAAPASVGATQIAAAQQANQASSSNNSPGHGKGGADRSVTMMVRWPFTPYDAVELVLPLSPARPNMVLKMSLGDYRVSFIEDEGQLCYTEDGGSASVCTHCERNF